MEQDTSIINVGTPLKNARREKFCLNLVSGMSQAEAARSAGYSPKNCVKFGAALATFIDVRVRLMELRDILASENIMSVAKRKERLTEIAQANLRDYYNSGGSLNPFGDTPNPGALAEVSYDPVEETITKVKLHDSIKAISELNKMERIYETGTTVNMQQNIVNVQVISPKAKELTDKIIEGDRT